MPQIRFEECLRQLKQLLDRASDIEISALNGSEVSSFGERFSKLHLAMSNDLKNRPEFEADAIVDYRRQVGNVLQEAAIVARNVQRPRGYYGDYETMEMMYRNGWEGSTDRGKLIHKMLVSGRECESVRRRRAHLAGRLQQILNEKNGEIHILSLACGPASEIRDLSFEGSGAVIHLLDQDEEAIAYAQRSLQEGIRSQTRVICADVLDFACGKVSALQELSFDFIYSAGLFDYLNDSVGSRVLRRCKSVLKRNGAIEVGNFALWPASFFVDMVCGWRLILRDRVAFSQLVPGDMSSEFIDVADQIFCRMRPKCSGNEKTDKQYESHSGEPRILGNHATHL